MRRVALGLLLVVLLLVGSAFFAWRWVEGAAHAPLLEADVTFEVPKGASGPRLPRLLAEAGLVHDQRAAQLYLKLHPAFPKFGKHPLRQGMSLAAVLDALGENPLADDSPVTVVEGWRLLDTDLALASLTPPLIAPGAYQQAASEPSRYRLPFPLSAPTLEGYLYPETYLMPTGHFDPEKLVQRQLDSFNEKFAARYAEEIAKSGHTLHELVTVASMLEREEPKPENRPKVAGIIFKRLDRKIPLGIDATSRYQNKDWNDRKKFLAHLRDADDPYNTRLRPGLPAGPIGAPSVASLLAALRPEASEWLYYLHDKEQNVHFARTASEHEANRKQFDIY